MKIIVIGATGTIGRRVADGLATRHVVVRASRSSRAAVDVADPGSVRRLLEAVAADGDVDAVVSCAASAPLMDLAADGFVDALTPKLLGQVEVVRAAVETLADGGSVTLTAGQIPAELRGAAGGALVNAGLAAFVPAAAAELPRGLRLNAVSPGWVAESLAAAGQDPAGGTPADVVAAAYVRLVEGTATGTVVTPG